MVSKEFDETVLQRQLPFLKNFITRIKGRPNSHRAFIQKLDQLYKIVENTKRKRMKIDVIIKIGKMISTLKQAEASCTNLQTVEIDENHCVTTSELESLTQIEIKTEQSDDRNNKETHKKATIIVDDEIIKKIVDQFICQKSTTEEVSKEFVTSYLKKEKVPVDYNASIGKFDQEISETDTQSKNYCDDQYDLLPRSGLKPCPKPMLVYPHESNNSSQKDHQFSQNSDHGPKASGMLNIKHIDISKSYFDKIYRSGDYAIPIPVTLSTGWKFKIPNKTKNEKMINLDVNCKTADENSNTIYTKSSEYEAAEEIKEDMNCGYETSNSKYQKVHVQAIKIAIEKQSRTTKRKNSICFSKVASKALKLIKRKKPTEPIADLDEPPTKRATRVSKLIEKLDPLGQIRINQLNDANGKVPRPKIKNINPEWYNFKKVMTCQVCDKAAGVSLVSHYVNLHPNNEVIISRIAPDVADDLRNSKNVHKCERIKRSGNTFNEYKQICYFCNVTKCYTKGLWIDHMAKHSGYYQYQCIDCSRMFSYNNKLHICKENNNIKKINIPAFEQANLTAFVCSLCNYVRFTKSDIRKHLKCEHDSEQKEKYSNLYDKCLFLTFPNNF